MTTQDRPPLEAERLSIIDRLLAAELGGRPVTPPPITPPAAWVQIVGEPVPKHVLDLATEALRKELEAHRDEHRRTDEGTPANHG